MSNEDAQAAILQLFEQVVEREGEIKDLRIEIKDAFENFCEEHEQFQPKTMKEGYRFFKKLAKDKSSCVDEEFQRDKVVEILIGKSV